MKYQSLIIGFLSIGTLSAWTGTAQAATLTHLYKLNNTLADSFGGSSLVANGGTLAAGGYSFAANQGPSLSNAINPTDYSILLDYSISSTSGFIKIVDFKNFTSDTGVYNVSQKLQFFPVTGATIIGDNVPVRLVLTRSAGSSATTGYFNGVQQFTFTDSTNLATFTAANNIINFFQDDAATRGLEASAGFVKNIAIYNGALSSSEVTGLGGFGATIPGTPIGTAVPEPFTIIGTLVGGTAALRMRKKLKSTANV
jgi:hypothetical protein